MSATASTAIVEKRAKPNLFQRIKAQNLLSFGPDGIDLELGPLNVLIGPNGSGKSNLLDVFSLFQAAPRELAAPVRKSGGVQDWIWRGDPESVAVLSVDVAEQYATEQRQVPKAIRHEIAFFEASNTFRLLDERILRMLSESTAQSAYLLDAKVPREIFQPPKAVNSMTSPELARDQSILSQRKDPFQFPEFDRLNSAYNEIRMYRTWPFGRGSVFTRAQSTDVISRPMAEDFSNAWIFMNRLRKRPETKAQIIEKIADIYEGVTDFDFDIIGSTVQVYLTEGRYTIPASRLSDGSLRYLCLLAILLDPEPPAFIAIEEPELGIHPDLIHKIADLLVDASTRTQLVVTTHSEILVDALHDRPEAVVVCEKHDGQTTMERLDASKLAIWLEKYRLGDLWTSGQLGGVRW